MPTSGELTKLQVQGYKKKESKVTSALFEAQFNPETIEISYCPDYSEEEYPGKIGSEMKWNSTKPQEFRFKIKIDQTLINSDSVPVNDQISLFKAHTIDYQNDTHEPPLYTEISWGRFAGNDDIFKGRLTQLDITYTQFKPDGEPIRAELTVAFKEYINFETMLKKQNKNSSDLTHQRTVLAGDTLPLMTQRIYGDAKYYKQVAKYNQLTSFRHLTPGTQINFPPLES